PAHPFGYLPLARAATRAGARVVLQTDINLFYPSVYTHTIPWAIHGKATAKANRANKLLGNFLDSLVRCGQDQQTIGIPIGPDLSLLLAEILLAAVDSQLLKHLPQFRGYRGYRYVDDYEFAFPTAAAADEALAALQSVLADFELQLNPRKTQIVDLPIPLEAPWAPEIRLYRIRSGSKGQATDVIDVFSKAFEFARGHREESVIKYAVARMRSEVINQSNWELYGNLLLQSAVVEPGTLDTVIVEFYRYQQAGYPVDRNKLAEAFVEVVNTHAPLEHGSEVAWVLWEHILFNIPMESVPARLVRGMRDPVVGLLLLHAQDQKLVPSQTDFSAWQALMKGEELRSENWLLAYEALLKGWLSSADGKDYVASDLCCSAMRASGVSFYDAVASQGFQPVLSVAKAGYGVGPAV
ncbi:MAG TPA: RNA-directed DNA polymerase, partial [Candidatus Tectomicrobia bacterium]